MSDTRDTRFARADALERPADSYLRRVATPAGIVGDGRQCRGRRGTGCEQPMQSDGKRGSWLVGDRYDGCDDRTDPDGEKRGRRAHELIATKHGTTAGGTRG